MGVGQVQGIFTVPFKTAGDSCSIRFKNAASLVGKNFGGEGSAQWADQNHKTVNLTVNAISNKIININVQSGQICGGNLLSNEQKTLKQFMQKHNIPQKSIFEA